MILIDIRPICQNNSTSLIFTALGECHFTGPVQGDIRWKDIGGALEPNDYKLFWKPRRSALC